MTDFETLVRDGLARGSEAAPAVGGLADAARRRHRSRRRTAVGAAAAVVALGVAVPVAAHRLAPAGERSVSAVDAPAPSGDTRQTASSDGMRVESFRDITLLVPTSWGSGPSSPCLDQATGELPVPSVHRPSDDVASGIACLNPVGYGVFFTNTSTMALTKAVAEPHPPAYTTEGYPAGAWVGWRHFGSSELLVRVVGTDERSATAVYESIRKVEAHDPNGCATTSDQAAVAGAAGSLPVCVYASDPGWLERSGRVDRAEWEAALAAAPVTTRPQSCSALGPEVVVGFDEVGRAAVRQCDGVEAVALSGTIKDLTPRLRQLLAPMLS